MQKAENCILLIQSMYPSFHRVEKKNCGLHFGKFRGSGNTFNIGVGKKS